MIPKNTTPTILATAASLMLATQAQAHAKLVGSTPVADTTMGGALERDRIKLQHIRS